MARHPLLGSIDIERIDLILRETQRLTAVLDRFRGFTRPLSGLSRTLVVLTEVASNVVSLHEGFAASRGVVLTLRAAAPVVVDCDAQKVKQALVNLVQNALEASPRGAEVEVSVVAESEENVALHVRDHGAGIDDAVRRKLFTPGFTTKDRGTGIGLVVARSAIEQHGGRLELVSFKAGAALDGTLDSGQKTATAGVLGATMGGTVATIVLPRTRPEVREALDAAEKPS